MVTDPDLRREIAKLYEQAYEAEVAAALQSRSLYAVKVKGRLAEPSDPSAKQRILDGAEHLARNPDDAVRAVTHGNAAEVYRIPVGSLA